MSCSVGFKGIPILARPPSLRYRPKKWVRKHRVKALVAVVLFIASLATVGGVGYGIAERQSASKQKNRIGMAGPTIEDHCRPEKDRSDSLAYGNAMIAATESFFTDFGASPSSYSTPFRKHNVDLSGAG